MRPLQKYLSILFLAVFISASLFIAPQIHAGGPTLKELITGKTLYDYGKEFCDKRTGDLMNLETWYSGKCGKGVDTMSGDGVGFSDIVILQGFEYVIGPQYDSYLDMIINMLNGIVKMRNLYASGAQVPQNNFATTEPGVLPALAKITTGFITTKPASSIDYIAYVSSNLKSHHIINQAYAAGGGYGFQSLAPILPLWRAFRNIAYILFAFGFILYGVMIMFRIKIDAKTAATIQLAIPRLIATLVVITFSYAIVGFMIDIATVISVMVINILAAGGILYDVNSFLPKVAAGQYSAIGSFLVNMVAAILVSPLVFFNLLVGGVIGAIVGTIVALTTMSSIGMVISFIIFLMVGYSYVKLIMKLFTAFFSIIISLIFSPIILLGNLMPGSTAISTWLLSIVGNLAVFPVASFFLVLSYALMCQPILSIIGSLPEVITKVVNVPQGFEWALGVKNLSTFGNIWTPPMTIPFGDGTSAVGSLMLATIGFGLLMMASKYCEMVEKALKTPPFPYGAAIGEALKYGRTAEPKGYGMLPAGARAGKFGQAYERGQGQLATIADVAEAGKPAPIQTYNSGNTSGTTPTSNP